jgi:hypothetical protein
MDEFEELDEVDPYHYYDVLGYFPPDTQDDGN